jgi:cytochrome oxidase Cu insertion factor (SCO1/SenC/PrrC family)
VLKEYAQAFGANLAGWAFLTGTPDAIRDVTRRYGVCLRPRAQARLVRGCPFNRNFSLLAASHIASHG